MCVSREAGFCAANDFAIAISQTIANSFDNWVSRPKIQELYCYTYILQQKDILEVSRLHLQGFTNKTKAIK